MTKSSNVLICYAQQDATARDTLLQHLSMLVKQQQLMIWEDSRFELDADWKPLLIEALAESHTVLLLVSPSFMNSFFNSDTLRILLKSHQQGGLHVVPILLSACNWSTLDFCKLKALPRGFVPIDRVHYPAQSWQVIARRVQEWCHQAEKRQPVRKPRQPSRSRYDTSRLPDNLSKVFGRIYHMTELDKAFHSRNTSLVSIIAGGGAGKTTLLRAWLERIQPLYGGAERVFAWSFSRQGDTRQGQATATLFFETALPFFGHQGPLPTNDSKRAERLLQLMREQPCILLLDGLEALQYSPKRYQGRLADMALRILIQSIQQQGMGHQRLIVLTSRQPVFELQGFDSQGCLLLRLDSLSSGDGSSLLQSLGVRGSPWQLSRIARLCGGHTLALVLLSHLLVDAYAADADQHVRCLSADLDESLPPVTLHNEQIKQILTFYDTEIWPEDSPARMLLSIISLLDRPMQPAERMALINKSEIGESLNKLGKTEWEPLCQTLQSQGLLYIYPHGVDMTLDTHPMIRSYFHQQLKEQHFSKWQQAHQVLMDYFTNVPADEQPDSLLAMEPLYRAMYHGCLAGAYRRVLDEVYHRRILRGGEYYSTRQLGAYAQDLAAIAQFFTEDWQQPVSEKLSEYDQSWLLAQASFYLMASGRLEEAAGPQQLAMQIRERSGDWQNAAYSAINLVDLLLTLGQLGRAEQMANYAIDLANRSRNPHTKMLAFAKLGTALHYLGDLDGGRTAFEQAERLQAEDQPDVPRLYSLAGVNYCALLLDMADNQETCKAILQRAWDALEISSQQLGLMSIALDHMTAGQAMLRAGYPPESIQQSLEQAQRTMRRSNVLTLLPSCLLMQAWFQQEQGQLQAAIADCEEALSLSLRCSMRLYEAEARLLRGHLWLDQYREIASRVSMDSVMPAHFNLHNHHPLLRSADQACQIAAEIATDMLYERLFADLSMLSARLMFYNGQHQDAIAYLNDARRYITTLGQWGLLRRWEHVHQELGFSVRKIARNVLV